MHVCHEPCKGRPFFTRSEVAEARIRVRLKRSLRRRGGAFAWVPANLPTAELIRLTRES